MVKYVILVCISGCLLACTEKLDLKPDESKLIPKTIEDFQALLDAPNINDGFPAYGEGGADNYYITDSRFNSLSWIEDRSAYIWKDQIYSFTSLAPDWSWSYSRVSNSNLVLEGLDELKSESGSTTYNGLKGSALFLRACTFYTLAEIFCKPYDSTSANTDLGIPLRTSSDINIIFQRSSLQDTYDRIISDLNIAATLLPEFSLTNSRPSRAAAYGLLARIYLTIGDYESAINNAEKSLQIRHDVLDYNTVEGNEDFPFKPDNNDVLFYGIMAPTGLLRISTTFVDTFLYKQFEENDLRKALFFGEGSSGKLFKGSYSGEANSYFGGISVSEILLTRAECYARMGKLDYAMKDLNMLLRNRWRKGTYTDQIALDPNDALDKILMERRKELIFRGLRWSDLRRLNRDPRFAKTLTRIVEGVTYRLPPNDPKYVYPIPESEIKLSGIQQNVRQ